MYAYIYNNNKALLPFSTCIVKLESSLALTHIMPIYNKLKYGEKNIYSVHNKFFKMITRYYFI